MPGSQRSFCSSVQLLPPEVGRQTSLYQGDAEHRAGRALVIALPADDLV